MPGSDPPSPGDGGWPSDRSPGASLRGRLRDGAWLNALLDAGGRWPHGPFDLQRLEPIGAGLGLSGEVHRLHGRTSSGAPVSIVAKLEGASATRQAMFAGRHLEPVMTSAMPAHYGAHIDDGGGLLLLEDIRPATQGDELAPCTAEQAGGLVRLIARLHAATHDPLPSAAPEARRWRPTTAVDARWEARVARAAERYADLFTPKRRQQVAGLPARAVAADGILARHEWAWIHVDAHLDNVLWRPDGSTVLLDWSSARIGPTLVDLAGLLISVSFCQSSPLLPDRMLDVYTDERAALGAPVDRRRLAAAAPLAVTRHLPGLVGWAGELSNDGFHERKAELRDDAIRRAFRTLDWLEHG